MDTIYAHNAAGLVSLAAARRRGGNRVDNAMYPCGWQAGNAVTSTLESTITFTTTISHKATSPNPVRPKESSP